MCPACAATVEVSAMRNAQRAVVTAEAIYSAATYSHRSWLMMNPPTGESVWTYSTLGAIAAQHLVWRTPITRDASSLIYMRLGNQLFPLRRKLILEGVDAAKTVAAAIPLVEAEAEGVKKKKPKPLRIPNHPFATLGDMADPGHGVLRTNLAAWAEAAGNAAAVRLLRCLTPGEKWALMPLLYTDKHPPTKPKILTREDFLSDKPLSVGTEA
jgi:CRISPR type IV-associated protein Csf1